MSLVADRWRDRGSLVESFFTHRESEREREREGDRYFEAQTVRNRIRVFENNKKKKRKGK